MASVFGEELEWVEPPSAKRRAVAGPSGDLRDVVPANPLEEKHLQVKPGRRRGRKKQAGHQRREEARPKTPNQILAECVADLSEARRVQSSAIQAFESLVSDYCYPSYIEDQDDLYAEMAVAYLHNPALGESLSGEIKLKLYSVLCRVDLTDNAEAKEGMADLGVDLLGNSGEELSSMRSRLAIIEQVKDFYASLEGGVTVARKFVLVSSKLMAFEKFFEFMASYRGEDLTRKLPESKFIVLLREYLINFQLLVYLKNRAVGGELEAAEYILTTGQFTGESAEKDVDKYAEGLRSVLNFVLQLYAKSPAVVEHMRTSGYRLPRYAITLDDLRAIFRGMDWDRVHDLFCSNRGGKSGPIVIPTVAEGRLVEERAVTVFAADVDQGEVAWDHSDECPARFKAMLNGIKSHVEAGEAKMERVAVPDSCAAVSGVHGDDYVRYLQAMRDASAAIGEVVVGGIAPSLAVDILRPWGFREDCDVFFGDSFITPAVFDAALAGAVAAQQAVQHLCATDQTISFCLARPPGHHAFPGKAGGFCFFSNTALAVAKALELGAQDVMVLDIDFHRGDGTEACLLNMDSWLRDGQEVRMISPYAANRYPGWNAAQERHETEEGVTGKVKVASQALGEHIAYEEIDGKPCLKNSIAYQIAEFYPNAEDTPQVIVVSLGFDGHESEEHCGANWDLEDDDYVQIIVDLRTRFPGAKLLFVTEGGYMESVINNVLQKMVARAFEVNRDCHLPPLGYEEVEERDGAVEAEAVARDDEYVSAPEAEQRVEVTGMGFDVLGFFQHLWYRPNVGAPQPWLADPVPEINDPFVGWSQAQMPE